MRWEAPGSSATKPSLATAGSRQTKRGQSASGMSAIPVTRVSQGFHTTVREVPRGVETRRRPSTGSTTVTSPVASVIRSVEAVRRSGSSGSTSAARSRVLSR